MLKNTIKKVANLFGVSIINKRYLDEILIKNYNEGVHSKSKLINTVFAILKEVGFYPKHIIDVGANKGVWSREVMKQFPDSYFTLIEPQSWLNEHFKDLLNKSNVHYLPIGVSDISGEFQFTIHERDDSSSFRYNTEESQEKGYKQIPIKVKTLNQIVKESDFPKPDVIKIDAEGLDLLVLKGALEVLNDVEVIFIEAGIGNRNFENSIFEVINVMDSLGFVLFDITDLNRSYSKDVLWLVELVFIKKVGKIDNWVKNL